jgi:tRNA threonylcarbamoyl adenosine modification protein (Sua5/YciO/YrdC/YwlC family)
MVARLKRGEILLYPTDTTYAIGCDIAHKGAVQRVRQLKRLSNDKPLTFLCPSLSNIAQYAYVSDSAYRLMRRLVPGPFTFLLPATKLVPKLVADPKRKTTGIRIPDSPICQALLAALQNPLVSTSAKVGDRYSDNPFSTVDLFKQWEKRVDIAVDDEQPLQLQVSTIIDLTGDEPEIVRKGLGYERVEAVSIR